MIWASGRTTRKLPIACYPLSGRADIGEKVRGGIENERRQRQEIAKTSSVGVKRVKLYVA